MRARAPLAPLLPPADTASMGRRKTPQQKKAESYAKDTVLRGRHQPSTALRTRYRHAEHAYRHAIARNLHGETLVADPLDTEETLAVAREAIRRWQPTRLGEYVANSRTQRVKLMGYSYYRRPYDGERDRERYKRFLSTVIASRTPSAVRLASLFKEALAPLGEQKRFIQPAAYWLWGSKAQRRWLAAFFADEPEREARLRAWMAELLPGES